MPIIFKGTFTEYEKQTLKATMRSKSLGKERIEVSRSREQVGVMLDRWPMPHWERSVDELIAWVMQGMK